MADPEINGQDCCDAVEELQKRDKVVLVHLIRVERRTVSVFTNLFKFGFLNSSENDKDLRNQKRRAAWLALIFNWVFAPVGSVSISLFAAWALWFQFQELSVHREELDVAKESQDYEKRVSHEWQLGEVKDIRRSITSHLDEYEARIVRSPALSSVKIEEIIDATFRWSPSRKMKKHGDGFENFQSSLARGELLLELKRDLLDSADVVRIVNQGIFSYADVTGTDSLKLYQFPKASNIGLDHSCFRLVQMKDIAWPLVNAQDAIWSGMLMVNCDFSGGEFSRCTLANTRAFSVDFSGSKFIGTNMIGFRADSDCSFEGVDIRGAIVEKKLYDRIKSDTQRFFEDENTIVVNTLLNI
jgi:hypothetical protein